MAKQFVFTTENVNDIMEKQSVGIHPARHMNPWWHGEIGVRKRDLVFGWTQAELDEFTKSAVNIHYFVNNYAQIKLSSGQYGQMKERDYQYNIFESYTKNRFTINMSSRQTGKCCNMISDIQIKKSNNKKIIPMFKLLFKYKNNKTFYDYIKYPIYWLLWKLN